MNQDLLALTHTADEYDKYLNAVVPPVFMNSLHVYDRFEDYCNVDVYKDDQFVYGRSSNPTVHILERKIAELEHGSRAVAFSSGMAACTAAIMATCKAGSHIVCMRDVYQPVKRFLHTVGIPRLNFSVTYVSGNDLDEIEAAIQDNTALMILESPATFVFRVVDLKAISEIAKRHGVITYIDNTCMTPLFQEFCDRHCNLLMSLKSGIECTKSSDAEPSFHWSEHSAEPLSHLTHDLSHQFFIFGYKNSADDITVSADIL